MDALREPGLCGKVKVMIGGLPTTDDFARETGADLRARDEYEGVEYARRFAQGGYILELSRYIHLNPVRAEIVAKPEHYPQRSYRSYLSEGKRKGNLVYRDLILKMTLSLPISEYPVMMCLPGATAAGI